jgi:IclR family transcriptional regulator, acetate operon repressor
VRLGLLPPIGVITIAGPTVRFTEERMKALGSELLSFASQMAAASGTSPFFQKPLNKPAVTAGRQPIYAP